jgi:ribosomal protein L11 methyltransferase
LYELRVRVPEALAEEVGVLMVEAGAGGVVEEPADSGHSAVVTYGDERALADLARQVSASLGKRARVELRPAAQAIAGWKTAFLEHLQPVRISRTLRLVPLHDAGAAQQPVAAPARTSSLDVLLEPVVAFGFGEHPTTRMAARAVEARCRAAPGARVLDVGTGTGVLAIVAVRTGAKEAVGVDIDGQAVAAAKANALRNGVEKRCRFSKTAVGRVTGEFDIVVANVDRNTLLRLAPSIAGRVADAGSLFVTGVLPSDGADLKARYGVLGLEVVARRREGDFLFLEMRRQRVKARGSGARRAPGARAQKKRKTIRKPRSR